MPPRPALLRETLRLLRSHGFAAVRGVRGAKTFEGVLNAKGGDIEVSISIADWNFVTYPQIRVLNPPADLPPLLPHVDSDNCLCYFSPGSVVLDRYDPAGAVLQCLTQATGVLGEIRTNPDYRLGDIQDEFLSHWLCVKNDVVVLAHLGTISPNTTRSKYFLFGAGDDALCVVSDDPDEANKLSVAMSGQAALPMEMPFWIFETDKVPLVPAAIPTTVKELLTWLKAWDRRVFNGLQRVLEKEPDYLKFRSAQFAIRFPGGWLGFGFMLNAMKVAKGRRALSLYKQYLHGTGGKTTIFKLNLIEMGPDFVHSRNLTYRDLSGKHVMVIGCGAIGSFLAESLVRLGAGTGGGELKLVDGDTLKPENLGRHALGYASLFKMKASELARELVSKFPLAKVVPVDQPVTEDTSLGRSQLVIDATGEEAVSEMLNAMRLARGSSAPPILHARVRGNGDCVQTFWAEGRKHACLRCLLSSERDDNRKERHPVLKDEPIRRRRGCTGYTPFSVAASLSAAALATEVVVDWLQRALPHPRLRTRAMSNANVYQIKDKTVERNPRCPACGKQDDSIQPILE